MWQRFTLYDIRVIGHYLGTLILFSTITMAIPLITAVLCGEWEPAARYLFTIGIAFILGSALRFLRIEPGRLNRQQALAVTGLAWIVLAFVASIPLYFSGHYVAYLDALYDSVSGLTTTGASIVIDLDHLSYADNMFRFMMHLMGGLGLIVVASSFGLFGKRAGASLYMLPKDAASTWCPTSCRRRNSFRGSLVAIILMATTIVTVLCLLTGMEPLRAALQSLWLSISAFTTGGFAPMSQSVLYYHSFPIELVLMVLMILGSINFVIHAEVWNGRIEMFFRDIEMRTMVIWLGVMTCVFAASLSASLSFSDLPAMLRRGLFMVISAFSTTGFQNITTNQLTTVFSSGAFVAIALIMAVGGASGSTSGGVKFSRVGIIFKSIVSTIKEALAPDSARVAVAYNHVGRRMLSPVIVKEAMTVFILYVITYVIGALVGIAHGYEATPAIFESVAMASNGGVTTGLATAGMPMSLELFYIFQMWAGRLEFVTLLALLVEIVVSFNPRRRAKQS